VVAGQHTTIEPLVLQPISGLVTGIARKEGETDQTGITVAIPGTDLSTETAADGSFSFEEVPPGTYVVQADAAGFQSASSEPFVLGTDAPSADVGVILLAIPRGNLAGTATLEGAANHGGILVTLQGSSYATLTGPTGNYVFSGVPVGQYTVEATHPNYVSATATDQTVEPYQTTDVPALVLTSSPGTLIGVAYKEGESDHTGILVTVNNTAHSGATQSDGSFTITGVPGGVYSVSAQANEYQRYDYPLVVLAAGDTVDLGEVTLEKAKGVIQGVVTLEGRLVHSGATIELLNTSHVTTSAADGSWSLLVPVGTYGGVRATMPHYAPDEELATINVTESGVANVAALYLEAIDNDVSGRVTLYGQASHTGISVELFGVEGTQTDGLYYSLITSDPTGAFTFTDIPIGPFRVRYSYQAGWSVIVRDFDVDPGFPIDLAPAELLQVFLLINNDAQWTNSAAVTLSLGSSDCYDMKVSNLSDLSDATWETCVPTKPWTLAGPDGINTVYAQYRDSQLIPGSVISDNIWLDRVAAITAVTENTAGAPKHKDDIIHFTVNASGEASGTATVDIAGFEVGIPLYDDGTHGDQTAGDGIYETDYTVPPTTDVNNAVVTGRFTDAHSNVAPPANAPGTVTIANPPVIFNVQIVPDSQTGYATISWDTNELTTGFLEWGETQFYGTQVDDLTVSTSHSVQIGGGTMVPSTEYHLRITATDQAGNPANTADRPFFMKPNPPQLVIALPGVARFDVRWEAPPQENVVGYNVYRSQTPGGPYTQLNTGGPYTHEALMYSDLSVVNGQTYYYVVTAVDAYNNESDYSAEVSGTPDVNSGPTYVSGVLVGNQVWTERESPYIVTGSLLVEQGNYLAVGPGVEVKFDGYYFLRVDGQAIITGGVGAEVRFTSNNASPAPGDWQNFQITATAPIGRLEMDEHLYYGGNLLYRMRLEYGGDSTLSIIGSTAALFHVTGEDNNGACAWNNQTAALYSANSTVLMKNSAFVNNTARGIHFDPGGGVVIVDSTISANNCGGAYLSWSTSNIILRTVVSDNLGTGIAAHGGELVIFNSVISGNVVGGSRTASALYCTAHCIVVNSDIANNTTTNDKVGAIYSYAHSMTLIGNTFSGNWADGINATASAITGHDTNPSIIELVSCEFLNHPASSMPLISSFRGTAMWNIFHGNQNSGDLFQMWHDVTLQYNSFLDNGHDYLVHNWNAVTASAVTATNNYWGPTVTATMDASGPNANISKIWDYYDNFDLSRVIYDNWAHGAYPLARIDEPRWGKKFRMGETITFIGHATDTEDGTLLPGALSWTLDPDTPLGTGDTINVSTLGVGHQKIWLTATDSDLQEGKVWVEIDVVE
jgi:hypothetical protein